MKKESEHHREETQVFSRVKVREGEHQILRLAGNNELAATIKS